MKNKIIATIIAAMMVFVCSATAFAEDITATTETEPTTVTETSATNTEAELTEEKTTDKTDEGVTIIREDVTLETTEPAETEIVIDTSDLSITESEPHNTIVFDYADTYTDIPNTGSNTTIGFAVLSATCLSVILLAKNKKSNDRHSSK